MKSLIYGYGETGKSFERYLTNKNLEFEIFDENISNYNKKFNLNDFDQILCSPGIPKSTFEEIIKENNMYLQTSIYSLMMINQQKLVSLELIEKAQQHFIYTSYLKTTEARI